MRPRDEQGESLIEILVSTAIMGIIGIGIIGSIAAVLISTDIDRKTSQAETVLRSYVAAIEDAPYQDCADAGAYAPDSVGFATPLHFDASVSGVAYWIATSGPTVVPNAAGEIRFDASCAADPGLQRVDVIVTSTDHRAVEKVTIFKRRAG